MTGIWTCWWSWERWGWRPTPSCGRVVSFAAVAAVWAGTLREGRWVALFMLINVVLNLDEGPMPYANGFSLMMPAALIATGAWQQRQRRIAALHRWRQPTPPLLPLAE